MKGNTRGYGNMREHIIKKREGDPELFFLESLDPHPKKEFSYETGGVYEEPGEGLSAHRIHLATIIGYYDCARYFWAYTINLLHD